MAVIGIGYQGRTQAELCELLAASDVGILCDVRLNPISRKSGLSKTALSAAVRSNGIDYLHLPALGNPRWNRAGFGGTVAELEAAKTNFRRLVHEDDRAQHGLSQLREASASCVIALLCFELDQSRCHRSVLLDELVLDQTASMVG